MLFNSISAASSVSSAGGSWHMFLPIIVVFAVFYFFMIMPQNKRMKEQQKMQSDLKIGDTILTSGGLIGRVTKLDEKEVHVDFNRTGQAVRVLRTSIITLMEPSNKAKTMTNTDAGTTQTAEKKVNVPKAEGESQHPPRRNNRSPMNRGRAGGNRKPSPSKKKTPEDISQ